MNGFREPGEAMKVWLKHSGCLLFVATLLALYASDAYAAAAKPEMNAPRPDAAAQETPDTQFGDFLFRAPNGWKSEKKDDAMHIVAPQLLPGTTTYIALAARDLDGDLQKSFNGFWAAFRNTYRVLQGGQINGGHTNKGYDAYFTVVEAADQAGHPWKALLVGAQYGTRLETVTFLSDLPEGAYFDAAMQTFQQFLANLSFGSDLPGSKIPSSPGPAGAANPGATGTANPTPSETPLTVPPGMLAGVYVSRAGVDGRPSNKDYIFYPDGSVMYGIPQNGMLGFDFSHYRAQDNATRNLVGRYRVEGDKVKIFWGDQYADPAKPAVIKLNEKAAHPVVDIGWNVFIPVCRCTGKTFSGTYRWGSVGLDQYLQFFADGTFIDHGVTDQLLGINFEHPRNQRGTYSIQSQTMIFNFADGHHGAGTFVAPKVQENDPSFDWMEVAWKPIYEEHYLARLAR